MLQTIFKDKSVSDTYDWKRIISIIYKITANKRTTKNLKNLAFLKEFLKERKYNEMVDYRMKLAT